MAPPCSTATTRRTAAVAFGWAGHGTPEVVSALIERLRSQEDWLVCQACATALGRLTMQPTEGVRAWRALGIALRHRRPEVREAAAAALAQLAVVGERRPREVLTRMLRRERDWTVRRRLVRAYALAGPTTPRVIGQLTAVATSDREDWEVRWAAVDALVAIGTPEAQAAVSRLLSAPWEACRARIADRPWIVEQLSGGTLRRSLERSRREGLQVDTEAAFPWPAVRQLPSRPDN